jgi:adenylate cyclase class IV
LSKEIELAIYDIDPNVVKEKLNKLGARNIGHFSFRRINFQVKTYTTTEGKYDVSWVRIRTDGKDTKITYKRQNGIGIGNRDEYEIGTDSFEGAAHIISKLLPQAEYDYFENKRDEYEIDGMHIEIDKFPYLPYTMEIEGDSETRIMELYKNLEPGGSVEKNKSVPTSEYYRMHGFDYSKLQKEYAGKIRELIGGSD